MGALASDVEACKGPSLTNPSSWLGHWPEDVERFKARLDSDFISTHGSVVACTAIPASERASWERFRASWQEWKAHSTGFWEGGSGFLTTCEFASEVERWRAKIAQYGCMVQGPVAPPPPGTEVSSAVKWFAAAVIVTAVIGGGVYVARMVR